MHNVTHNRGTNAAMKLHVTTEQKMDKSMMLKVVQVVVANHTPNPLMPLAKLYS